MPAARACVSAVAALLAGCARAPAPLVDATLLGFVAPRAVVHDVAADRYLVAEAAPDGARIARVAPDGSDVQHGWIAAGGAVELRSPRGMAIAGEELFVADGDCVRRFERGSGAPRGAIPVPRAGVLYGLSFGPDGALWIADAGADADPSPDAGAVHCWTPDGGVRRVAEGPGIGRPIDLVATTTGVFVATRGGAFLLVDGKGHVEPLAQVPGGELAGLLRPEPGRWLCASHAAHGLLEFDLKGGPPQLLAGVATGDYGDLDLDTTRERLLLPIADGRVAFLRLPHGR